MTKSIPVFDGHNDVLLRLYKSLSADVVSDFLNGEDAGHLDLKKARSGSFVGGFFALFSPPEKPTATGPRTADEKPPQRSPAPLTMDAARNSVVGELAILTKILRAAPSEAALCLTASEVKSAIATNRLAVVLHLEGAEAIDPDLNFLHVLYAAGLRSLGPVWSRPTVFGHGVPFKFPGDPDIGPGLTERGKDLVRLCNELGILIDLSHMNQKGFEDVAALSKAPLVATHSNVHALCPSPRNLTDRQLGTIRESGGMVGLNFSTSFLRTDGMMMADIGIDAMVRHIDYLVDKLGEDHVGLGSDFDGCTVPAPIKDVTGVPKLFQALADKGYDAALLAKLAHENWISCLERTLKA